MKILAGDIGGTKTLLQIAEVDEKGCHVYHEARFASAAWSGLVPLVEEFLQIAAEFPETACFAVAGPIDNSKQARLTNLPWEDIDVAHLASYFRMQRVSLINDFQAVGYGLDGLAQNELATLQAGQKQPYAPRALIGAGTGLGQGILVWQDGHYVPLDTEGGHVDFAPQNQEQERLWYFLRARYDHVSYERLLSGPGLVEIYQFLCDSVDRPTHDNAAAISTAAFAADPVAVHALNLFVQIYGQQAGNLALTCLARGGVYVAGGIAPRILPFMCNGEFMRAFWAKGRMERLLREMPVHIVLNHRVGLLGAAMVAAREPLVSNN